MSNTVEPSPFALDKFHPVGAVLVRHANYSGEWPEFIDAEMLIEAIAQRVVEKLIGMKQ